MKKSIFILFLFVSVIIKAQIINIPDVNFKNALLDYTPTIDTNNNGEIEYIEAATITSLYIASKNITDLTGIEAFTELNYLDCSGNNLIALNVSNNIKLFELWCDSNEITSLVMDNNPNLELLFCGGNNLSSIDLSHILNLYNLDISFNELNSIDTSQLTHLFEFNCIYNNISSVDVSNNPQINTLNLSNNNLTELDVSNLSYLWGLDCNDNNLNSLDLSNTGYWFGCFHCSGNENLTSIDLRNGFNENIQCFSIGNNPNLTCVYVDDVAYSNEHWYSDEQTHFVLNETECTSLSSEEIIERDKGNIYPNPFNKTINIDVFNKDVISVYIYNSLLQEVLVTDKRVIQTEKLESGIYFIKVSTSKGQTYIQKLIKSY